MRFIALILMTTLPSFVFSQASQGVIIRCGASEGHSFFFEGFANPDGPNWDTDRISGGKIILVRLGDEWDIQFDDAIGASGYRQDGAKLFPLMGLCCKDRLTNG